MRYLFELPPFGLIFQFEHVYYNLIILWDAKQAFQVLEYFMWDSFLSYKFSQIRVFYVAVDVQ